MASLEEIGRALSAADAAGAADDARALAKLYQHTKIQQQIENDPISQGARSFAKDMPVTQQVLSGTGKAFTDVARGAGQLAGLNSQESIDEAKRLDAPLMKTGGGVAGNILGNAALFAPTAAIPGANTYTGSALIGAAAGALQPVATGESRGLNTSLGAASGVLGQALGNGLGRVLSPVASRLSPEEEALARAAEARGIPLTAGQRTGSRPLQIAESVMENLPLTSGPQLAQRQAQKEAFNRAVGSTFGAPESAITPEVAGVARERIGQQFTDLASRNTLRADSTLQDALLQAQARANRELTPDVARIVNNRVDDILARVGAGDAMPGTAYRALDSEMGRQVRNSANGDVRNAVGELRSALRGAMDRSISGEDASAWQGARRQYANLMTVAPEAAKSATGDISGRTLLSAALRGNRNAKFGGPSDLAELGRIGRSFVADQIPNSGTAQRQMIQSLLTSGGGAGVGAGAALATGHNPFEGAAYGAGIGAGSVVAPRIAQALINSRAGQAYLKRGIVPLSQEARAAIAAALRTGAIASMPALAQ